MFSKRSLIKSFETWSLPEKPLPWAHPLHSLNSSIVYVQGYFSQTSHTLGKQDPAVGSHGGSGGGVDDDDLKVRAEMFVVEQESGGGTVNFPH